jgi:hypothetical protein
VVNDVALRIGHDDLPVGLHQGLDSIAVQEELVLTRDDRLEIVWDSGSKSWIDTVSFRDSRVYFTPPNRATPANSLDPY